MVVRRRRGPFWPNRQPLPSVELQIAIARPVATLLLMPQLTQLASVLSVVVEEGSPVLAANALQLLPLPMRRSPPNGLLSRPAASLAVSLHFILTDYAMRVVRMF